jgi:hypothetical protein
MIKASIDLQDLRRRLYVKAKAETSWRFWGLYVHICKMETLRQAYALAEENDGAPGVDGVTFEAIETQGVAAFLEQIRDELVLLPAVEKRLREELAALQVEINEEKSRIVDLGRGESFGFLGFDFRCIRSRRGVWRAHYTPKLKKRTALLRKLKGVFRRHRSQPVDRVIYLINPVLRGWVNYFAVGNSGECFSFIQDWVEKKVRRHMMRARKRKGFGWTRWSRQWLYETLKLFNGYKVRWPKSKVAPAG